MGHEKQGPFRVRLITCLLLDFLGLVTTTFQQMGFFGLRFFLQVGVMTHDISTSELHQLVSSQQKIECLGMLIPKTATSTSNGKYQLLLTRMPQAPCVLEGLILISIFAIHFLQAQFNQARLPCGLNSCIIFFFRRKYIFSPYILDHFSIWSLN